MYHVAGFGWIAKNINSQEGTVPLIKRFEDIQAWQEARTLTQQIY